MVQTLAGRETASLLERGADYIEAMGSSVGFDWLTAGPTADVLVNPDNPLKIQIILSSNSEDTQQIDLARLAEIIGGAELAAQTGSPVQSLDLPIKFVADDEAPKMLVHSFDLYEAVFTTTDGIDVSLTTIGKALATTDRRHQTSETPGKIRHFADFLGGIALAFTRVNIRLRDPEAISCHAHASCSSMTDVRETVKAIDQKILRVWEDVPDRGGGSEGLTSKANVDGANWQVSIYPDL